MTSIGSTGLDVQSLVAQLMQAERAPEQLMSKQKLASMAQQTAWQSIQGKLTGIGAAAAVLKTPTGVLPATSSSSDTTVLTAVGSDGAAATTTSISVKQVATSDQFTSGGLAGASTKVGAGTATITAFGGTGATAVSVSSDLDPGKHVVVVRGPQPARLEGTTTPTFPVTVTDLTITVGAGTPVTVNGTFGTLKDLNAAMSSALGPQGSVVVTNNHLRITSGTSGAGSTVSVSGASAAALGFTVPTATGSDLSASLDGGDFEVARADGSLPPLQAPGTNLGSLTVTGTALVPGTITTDVVRTTATSDLSDLIGQVNVNGGPASAALVDSGDGTATPFRLVTSANASGSKGQLVIDTSGLPYLASVITNERPAQDAKLVVGAVNGVGGVAVTRSSNTLTDVIPGVTLTVAKIGDATVTTARDTAGLTTKAKAVVDAVNELFSSIGTQGKLGLNGATAGPLAGDATLRDLQETFSSLQSSAVGAGRSTVLSQLGISIQRDGTFALDATKLTSQVQNDPSGTASLLSSWATLLADKTTALTATDGAVTNAGTAAGKAAADRQTSIDDLESRLKTVQARYTAQYASLNAAIATLQQQQSSLAGQILKL